jgi:sarcosine oxidase, subunit beta
MEKIKSQVDPDNYKQSLDTNYIEELAEKLLESAPGFSKVELQNGWSSVYPITPDNNPIFGELNEVKGFFNCIGFGGFVVQILPVFGEAMAELILDGETNLINTEKYSLYRFKRSHTTN